MRVTVPEAEDLTGKVIDERFEVIAKLGSGGMGTVYRANQASIGREVALKVIDRTLARDPATVTRFMREAKLASQLSHPNTVGVIEFGQDPTGLIYLVMELVRGKTLFDALKESGPMTVERVARIGGQLVDALEAAHALSIVHRDLKLENVMLLDGGRDLVKILDFGLARSFTDDSSRATATGIIAGTPRYLAPEVLDGAQPAPAQDLYALGVMLGELAVGGTLWDAPTFESLYAIKISGLPPVLDKVHPELRGLVSRLLAPAPSERPAHAEIRAALVALERGGTGARLQRAQTPLALEPTGLNAPEPALLAKPEPSPPPRALPDSAFAPRAQAAPKLEVEEGWREERDKRYARAHATRSGSHVWWILTLLVLVALGGAAWYFVIRPNTHIVTQPHGKS
jgi:serine/threonine-protein kinase